MTSTDEKEYRHRIWAWTMYDWANSAFATTILAVILPIYFSKVAGATLPNPALATSYWSAGLSVSLLIVAILSPILGTVSDISRSKKRFLAAFASLGILSTALLVLVGTGDWVLASILAILGRIGFNGSVTFYDSLLPHIARPEDQDRVSARGFAVGYLGGGLLLVINVIMLQLLPGTWGARLSFLSVAIWWAIFSLPLLLRVPEPKTATEQLGAGENIFTASFQRIWATIHDVRRYRELFKYLLAFLIYNDGIGTIIGVAAIYGSELGLGDTDLILALLLVQFAGIPYSLIFGKLPSPGEKRRPMYLAFILFNLFTIPLAGTFGARFLPASTQGNLGVIIGLIAALQATGLAVSMLSARLLRPWAEKLDTQRSILLSLVIYSVIAVWGYFIHSILEFWLLAWMVSIVQGGSQALSRSLYAALSPASKSGEFFGLFGVMEKFASLIGPLMFALAGIFFGSTRPAILSLIVLFVAGGLILARVDVARGREAARE
ncbi:MAG: MFS transporter [Chloroflexota bacterium]